MVLSYGEKLNGARADMPTNPTKDGTSFEFWYYIDEDGNEKIAYSALQGYFDDDGKLCEIDERFVATKDTTLYARWNNEMYTQQIYSIIPIDTHNSAKIKPYSFDKSNTYFKVTKDLTVDKMSDIVTFDYEKADDKNKDKTFLGWYSTQMAEYGKFKVSEGSEQVKNCEIYAVFSPIVVNVYDGYTNEIVETFTYDEPSKIPKLKISDMPDHTNNRAEDGYYTSSFYIKQITKGYKRGWNGDDVGKNIEIVSSSSQVYYQDFDIECRYHQPYVRVVTINALYDEAKIADFDEKVVISHELYDITNERWKSIITNFPDDAEYSDVAQYLLCSDDDTEQYFPYDTNKTLRENLADNNMEIPLNGYINISYAPKDMIVSVESNIDNDEKYYYEPYIDNSLREYYLNILNDKAEEMLEYYSQNEIKNTYGIFPVKRLILYIFKAKYNGELVGSMTEERLVELFPELGIMMNCNSVNDIPDDFKEELIQAGVPLEPEYIYKYIYSKYNLVAEWTEDTDIKDYIAEIPEESSDRIKLGQMRVTANEDNLVQLQNINYKITVPNEISIYDASFTMEFTTPLNDMFLEQVKQSSDYNELVEEYGEGEAINQYINQLKADGRMDLDAFANEVTITFDTSELNFEEQGFKLKMYEDAERTIPLESITFTEARNKVIYLKLEETSSVHRLGSTSEALNFSIDAKY